MKKCIICKEELTAPSVEHILPEALGGRRTIRTVCKNCNSALGSWVDSPMTNDPTFLFLRDKLQIKNRDGKTVELETTLPLFDENGERVIVKTCNMNGRRFHYDGSKKPIVIVGKNETGKITVEYHGSDLDSIVNKAKHELKKEKLAVDPSAIEEDVRRHVTVTWSTTTAHSDIIYRPERYRACFVKMAYEIAMSDLEGYEQDPLGEKLRLYLLGEIKKGEEAQIPMAGFGEGDSLENANPCCSAQLRESGGRLFVEFNLFNSVHFQVPISDKAERYDYEKYRGFTHIWTYQMLLAINH